MSDRHSGDTLLAHLAGQLSSRHEDIAVEALGYILKSEPARHALEELVGHGDADVIQIDRVETQVIGVDDDRPDLVGVDAQDRECLLIEAKFWAGLTENQPNTYLARASKAVMFVAPASRIEPLWAELRRRAGVESRDPSIDSSRLKSVATDGEKHLMLTSWDHLLDHLEASGSRRVEIEQLRGLAERADDESGFPPLRSDELSPEIPRRLRGLKRLLLNVRERSVAAGVVDENSVGRISSDTEMSLGLYMSVAGASVWFGIHLEWWAKGTYPDTPLWLMFYRNAESESMVLDQTRVALQPLARRNPPECFEHDKRDVILVPIMLPTAVEFDEVVESVVRRLGEVFHLIDNVGSA